MAAEDGVLVALVDSTLTVISQEALDALLRLPVAATTLLEQLAVSFEQEAIGTFGSTGEVESVRDGFGVVVGRLR